MSSRSWEGRKGRRTELEQQKGLGGAGHHLLLTICLKICFTDVFWDILGHLSYLYHVGGGLPMSSTFCSALSRPMFTAHPPGLSPSPLGSLVNSLAASGQLSCNFPLLYFMLLLAAAPFAALSSATVSWPGVFSLLTPQLLLSQSLQVPNAGLKTHSQDLWGVYSFLLKSRLAENVTYPLHSSEAGHFPHYKTVDSSHESWNVTLKSCCLRGRIAHCC